MVAEAPSATAVILARCQDGATTSIWLKWDTVEAGAGVEVVSGRSKAYQEFGRVCTTFAYVAFGWPRAPPIRRSASSQALDCVTLSKFRAWLPETSIC